MSLPSVTGIPQEMHQASLDYSLPQDARSRSVRVQPSNVSSIVSPAYTATAGANLDLNFPSQQIIFDIPCGGSPSLFLDSRMSTLSYRATISVVTAGTDSIVTSGYLRSNANSFFDRMFITAQAGNILEDVAEYGLTCDTLLALQMSNSIRDGIATQYGFLSDNNVNSQGHAIGLFTAHTLAANETETHAYSVPILSSVIGVTADKFLNIGRTSKLQCVFQTTSVLPLSILAGTATAAGTFQVTLSDFSLQLEYIDIGLSALSMLDKSLVDGKQYIHGVTYRTVSNTLPANISGTASLLAGIRASSVKSLFVRFFENGALGTNNSTNGKYDAKNPLISNIAFNIAGTKYPQVGINPLLNPSQSFREVQMAIGSFNSSAFTSSITPANYCKLSAGGTAKALNLTAQEYTWSLGSSISAQCQYFFGQNLEIVAKRGLLSGLNCTSAPVFLDLTIAAGITNAHTMYVQAMVDSILIHDVLTGDISSRT